MISEEMIKNAATEADQAIRDSLPAPAKCEHKFSPLFQRKMCRSFRMVKHPVIYKLPRYAACFVLAAALASGTWLTANAEARTAFFAWMREQYEAFVEYRFTGEASQENESADYELTWLPEGFSLQKEQNLDGGTYLTYTDDSGQRIIFSCLKGDDAASLFVTSDYTEVQSTQVGDICADFYQADGEASSNMLVWSSAENDLVFYIMADVPESTMIKMAEGVQKNNSKKPNPTVQNDLLYSFTGYKRIKEVIPLKKHFFPIMCTLMLSALFSVTVGCSGNSNDQAGKQEQGSHLLSLKVKVIEMVDLFLVEALESYKDEIKQGDTISVAADSTKVSDILRTYQEHNSFRIYFPKIDDTSDGISVTCLDVVQYDSSGEIIQQAERQ